MNRHTFQNIRKNAWKLSKDRARTSICPMISNHLRGKTGERFLEMSAGFRVDLLLERV